MLWVGLTIAAAFVQNLRFMLQKHLSDTGLSPAGATYARYLWSAPFTLVGLLIVFRATGDPLPAPEFSFWAFIALGGVTQILATLCVIMLFARRNFAVGTTFKRTEAIQSAIIGVIILGEVLPAMGWAMLALGLVGVVLLSKNPIDASEGLLNTGTALGLASGFFFGICGVSYRAASLSLGLESPFQGAVVSLTAAIWIQLVILSVYFVFFERAEVMRVIRAWRTTMLVSLTSLTGSYLMFTAFTIQKVAYVTAVQQVELIFAALGSRFFFKEAITMREIIGMAIVSGSIVLLLLFG